jgi:multidrug resistance efflux pump
MTPPSKARKIVPIAVVIILGAAAATYYWFSNRPKELLLSGTVEAHSIDVGSLVGGRVQQIFVDDGSAVQPGQRVAVLQSDTIARQMDEQKATIEASRANLAKALNGNRSEDVQKAQVLAAAAEKERKRYESLLHQGIVSREAYDAKAVEAKANATDLERLRNGSRSEDIAVARAQLERDQRRLSTLGEQQKELVVVAPIAGTVQSMGVRPGDLVGPNQPVAQIVEQGQLWVTVYVPETELGLIRNGMPARITVDTFPRRAFKGHVIQIATEGEYTPRNVQTRSQRADQVFGVKVAINGEGVLKPGMAADVDFGVKGRE